MNGRVTVISVYLCFNENLICVCFALDRLNFFPLLFSLLVCVSFSDYYSLSSTWITGILRFGRRLAAVIAAVVKSYSVCFFC